MIRVLHLSDFHFDEKYISEYKAEVENLCKSLDGQSIDIVVFSGDLVNKGTKKETFSIASDVLFNRLLETVKCDKNNLLVVPGNHDVDRTVELDVITEGIERISTVGDLDKFVSTQQQKDLSFERMKSYIEYIKDFSSDTNAYIDEYCFVNILDIDGKRVGLVGLNSAWRCFDSKKDRGNLLLPKTAVFNAMERIKDCQFVICSMHHDIHDFKDFVMLDIEDLIYEKCHLLLTGHYHKSRASLHVANEVGLLHTSAAATVNVNDKSSKFGYTIIEIDDYYHLSIHNYVKVDGRYIEEPIIEQDLPMNEDKKSANKFRKNMRKLKNDSISRANDLFVTGRDIRDDKGYGFIDLFGNPVIKDKSIQEIINENRAGNVFSLQSILESQDNILLYGSDKCGKTSLLWKLLLDALDNYDKLQIIPVLIDCDDYKYNRKLNIRNDLQNKLEVNRKNLDAILEKYTILVLLDNYDNRNKHIEEHINEGFENIPHIRIIACGEERLSSGVEKITIADKQMKNMFIHNITYKEIHHLTMKWPNLSIERKREFEEKIEKLFEQIHIPLNYWTATLFLWIMEKTDQSNIRNNFELVQLYIDELLDKKGIVQYAEINIQYSELQSYLGSLAEYLLQYEEDDYSITYQDLVNMTEKHISMHKKFTESSSNTINTLLKKGVIYENKEGHYTFRLKGVFEYFLALRMSECPQFLDDVKRKWNYYLSFGNEFELYAGFKKDDVDFVKFIYERTREILSPLTKLDDYYEIDEHLRNDVVRISSNIASASSELMQKIDMNDDNSDDEGGLIMLNTPSPVDNSKVERKKRYEDYPLCADTIMKALFILSRVYRNSNICDFDSDNTPDEILNFVLTGSCNMGLRFMNECENSPSIKDKNTRHLVKTLMQFMPILVEAFLYDAIAQKNLKRVLEEKLKDLKKTPEGNQFRIFLLTFILLDLDLEFYYSLLDDLDKYINKGVLRYASHCKILIYAAKNSDNANTRERLIKKAVLYSKQFNKDDNFENEIRKNIESKILENKTKRAYMKIDYKS